MTGIALWQRLRARMDWALVLTVLAVAAIGLINLYSSTRNAPVGGMFESQVRMMAVGGVIFLVASILDYRVFLRWSWLLLAIGVVAVVGVHFAGNVVKGSRRWIGFGGFALQPSEFV